MKGTFENFDEVIKYINGKRCISCGLDFINTVR